MPDQNTILGETGDNPTVSISPGKVLSEKLREYGMTLKDLAIWSGVSPVDLTQIIGGKRKITADVAVRFSAWLDTDPRFWLELQTKHDIDLAWKALAINDEVSSDDDAEPNSRDLATMSNDEAREFLLKPTSYCAIDLPDYFAFETLLGQIRDVLSTESLQRTGVRDCEQVNHRIMTNKDGRFAWRPLELLHPALYVSLVEEITKPDHWRFILRRFEDFSCNGQIRCLSLPVESLTDLRKDKAEQIRNWHSGVEQKSIELSLDYEYLIQTDIEDCYPSIYTHSIAWALHEKETAKSERRNFDLIGNTIDARMQDMRLGQTNGIPQGSLLMDFIAEIVLGYADTELAKRCEEDGVHDYKILRYRDDYRIFVNNPPDGERILKHLTEVLIDLGLKLNSAKTNFSGIVVKASLKDDKLAWMFRRQRGRNLQSNLLMIHDHGLEYPNAGGFVSALASFHERLHRTSRYGNPLPLLAIAVDIAYRNPRTYPYVAAILGELIKFVKNDAEKLDIVDRIRRRFSRVPNSGHMDIWLQRISFHYDLSILYNEPLCQLVSDEQARIWNNDWISSKSILAAMDPTSLVNRELLWDMGPTISPDELRLFEPVY